jgi:glycosyltransferase involved in cell wall biosynthesis
MSPRVSINLCCYNSEKYLRETLNSIVNQTYKDWQLVVINDGSSDSTESIIYEYIKQGHPIIYRYQENKGLGHSRNEALKYSQGEYIAFIDHDDIWLMDKLQKQVSILENNPEAGFIYGNYYIMKGNRKILVLRTQQPQGNVFGHFLYRYPVAIVTTMIRKKAIAGSEDFFDTNLSLAEDFDFFLRLLYKSRAIYQNEPVAIYRVHPGMNSIKFMEQWPDEMAYVLKKFGSLYKDFEKNYPDVLSNSKLEQEYSRAKMLMRKGDLRGARIRIKPYRLLSAKYFFLYLFSYMPTRVWNIVSLYLVKSPF